MNINVVKQKGKEELRVDQKIADKQESKSKLLFYTSISILAMILFGIGLFFYWSVQTGTILEVKNNPVPVRPTMIDKDQYLLLHYDYCKYSDAEGVVISSLVSKTSILPLPEAIDRTGKSCRAFDAPYPVPGQTPPGTYHYEFKACYPLNPIKTTCVEWQSKEFTIKGTEIKRNIEVPKK